MMRLLTKKIWLSDPLATAAFASQFASVLTAPLVLALQGEIGAGKTTCMRAILTALGWHGSVKSPTFSLVESYPLPQHNLVLHHFDLYRIGSPEELIWIGWQDYFTSDAICCIEWPECAREAIGQIDISLSLYIEAEGRWLELSAETARGASVFHAWQQ